MTETMSPTHINPLAAPKRQCLGIAVHETDARVIDPDTLEELGDAAVGEIIVHGPQVLRGYWNRPDAEASSFIERSGKRFLRTGDLGYRDSEGYFFAVERLKRMINVSGFKVWPAEVEATTAAAREPSNLAHVFVVQVNQIAKRADIPHCAWLGRSIAVDVALHFERPFFAVLTPPERLGHITGLAADLDTPISGCQLSEGRHACALRLSCAPRGQNGYKRVQFRLVWSAHVLLLPH